jgi:peptidoglycan hydrolase-like protein with peptidoglycan-binding domain
MGRRLSGIVATGIIILATAASAWADGAALVVGNRTYRRAPTMYEAERVLDAVGDLQRAGYSVEAARDVGAEFLRRSFAGFLGRVNTADRAVIVLSGHFVHSASETWFLPIDSPTPNIVSVNFDGIALSSILDLAAMHPGRVAVFLGTFPRDFTTGTGVKPGIGALDIPQGVFVATGKPEEIALSLGRDFLAPGVGFARALELAPPSIEGFGFVSDAGGLTDAVDTGRQARLIEEGFWNAVESLGTEEAYGRYLSAYPNGAYAAEARARLDALRPASPEEQARAAEDALNLSRDQRRAIQEHLSLLGYDTRGVDGVFGRGSRAAIGSWQRDNRQDQTGYLTGAQIARLEGQAQRRARELAEEARREQLRLEQEDRDFWQSSGAAAGDVRGLRRYLRTYPDGLFADVARVKLDAFREEQRRRVPPAERNAWEKAETSGLLEDYEAYLARYPDGAFADEAKEKLDKLREEAAQAAEIEAAKRAEDELQLNGFGRLLIENQLAAVGIPVGRADGVFDDDSRKAIRIFQRTRGFPVTGYVSRAVIVRLVAEAGR